MHLLKYVSVNIIAARKICQRHDRLLSNRMLGGFYNSLAAETKQSQSRKHHLFQLSEAAQPQFGGTLTASSQNGYIVGICKHIMFGTSLLFASVICLNSVCITEPR